MKICSDGPRNFCKIKFMLARGLVVVFEKEDGVSRSGAVGSTTAQMAQSSEQEIGGVRD